MESGPVRDKLLDAVHRRALALARMTAPASRCRLIDVVMAMPAGNLMRTLCVVLGRPFFDEMLDALLGQNDQRFGLCRFCRKGEFIEDRGMCESCWNENAQIDRELDEQELMDATTDGKPS